MCLSRHRSDQRKVLEGFPEVGDDPGGQRLEIAMQRQVNGQIGQRAVNFGDVVSEAHRKAQGVEVGKENVGDDGLKIGVRVWDDQLS